MFSNEIIILDQAFVNDAGYNNVNEHIPVLYLCVTGVFF